MNLNLLRQSVQEYLWQHPKADILRVVLGKSPFEGISSRELAEQLESRDKAQLKLPTWYATPGIYYPAKLSIEQCSSEITAAYKSGIVPADAVADLTGGFGVDSFYFSRKARQVFYCEQEPGLAAIAAHNFSRLGASNIQVFGTDGLEWLQHSGKQLDLVYLDPSRRNKTNKRVFLLSECIPDVTKHRNLLLNAARNVLVKSSPLLDLSAGLKELESVREIHIVAADNEVKEVVWVLEKGSGRNPLVKTINIKKDRNEEFEFNFYDEKEIETTYSEPQSYLYEPNSAIMKSGGYKSLGRLLKLAKLHEHTHLYTSQSLVNFPGRSFKIVKAAPFKPKNVRHFSFGKANISTRNFPLTVAEIRKRFAIDEGGTEYLFFTRSENGGLIVIECRKI